MCQSKMTKSLDQSVKLFNCVISALDKNASLNKCSTSVTAETECVDYESSAAITDGSERLIQISGITITRTAHGSHDSAVYARVTWLPGQVVNSNSPLMIEYLKHICGTNLALHAVHCGVAAAYRLI